MEAVSILFDCYQNDNVLICQELLQWNQICINCEVSPDV